MKESIKEVYEKIKDEWHKCVRTSNTTEPTLIVLPHPFTVPCKSTKFQEQYYWDTYFTNIGLIAQGEIDQARNNVENLLYEMDRLGFIPNASRTYFLSRSQPPYLSSMVKDVYSVNRDKKWLSRALGMVQKEYYSLWCGNDRYTYTGLSRYYAYNGPMGEVKLDKELLHQSGHDMYFDSLIIGTIDKESITHPFLKRAYERISQKYHISVNDFINNLKGECESGWDYSPRFDLCFNVNPVDLNANLYKYEMDIAHFYEELGWADKSSGWREKAEKRKQLINQLMWHHTDNLYYDYDFIEKSKKTIKSLAGYQPMWAGLASLEQAQGLVGSLKHFEYDWGLAACSKESCIYMYQWDYPVGWAPLHWIVIKGLLNYGYENDAWRIAEKWLKLIIKVYKEQGEIFEKYNVVEGSIANMVNYGRYDTPPMMGWTAGVFVKLVEEFNLL